MCEHNSGKHPIVAAVFFAATPAVVAGLVTTLFSHWSFGLIVGAGVFGLGMDVLLNGSDNKGRK